MPSTHASDRIGGKLEIISTPLLHENKVAV
jgi:hypothetical protein